MRFDEVNLANADFFASYSKFAVVSDSRANVKMTFFTVNNQDPLKNLNIFELKLSFDKI